MPHPEADDGWLDESEPRIGKRPVADATYHKLSRELMWARMRACLVQRQVAKRMGTSTSALSRLENAIGHRPTLTTLERYAKAVGCSLEIRLVDDSEAWYRELRAIADQRVREPDEVGD